MRKVISDSDDQSTLRIWELKSEVFVGWEPQIHACLYLSHIYIYIHLYFYKRFNYLNSS